MFSTQELVERAFLVGVEIKRAGTSRSLDDSLEELAQLTSTAGAEVVGVLTQHLASPTPAYYLGKGKLEELASLKKEAGYDLVVFDAELSPTQQRNIEQALGVRVIDRTVLILDIFAQRAHTREGRLQVELAQHEYLLSHLAGRWPHLERLGGGIGTRGPGETQLETDRRLIERKLKRLKGEIEEIRKHRTLYRSRRSSRGIPVVALVGYTNSGKSTLLNALTKADVFVEDKLFATLDPTTRRAILPNKRLVLFTDTVGFIQDLPPTLIAAFRATLEELAEADLLLRVVDISHRRAAEQGQTVDSILSDLGLRDKPMITVFNKIDLLMTNEEFGRGDFDQLRGKGQAAVLVSALNGWGLERLVELVAEMLEKDDLRR